MDPQLSEPFTLDELAAAWATVEQASAVLARTAAQFEIDGAFADERHLSMAAWLRSHCRLSATDAAGLLHRGRFLLEHLAVGAAAVDGRLSAGQVAAIRGAVAPEHRELFAEQQGALVDIVVPLSVADTRTVMQAWRAKADALADRPPRVVERSLNFSTAADGTVLGRFVLDPAAGAELATALRIAHSWQGAGDTRSHGRHQADSLFDVLAFFNANHGGTGSPRHRPHVEVIVDLQQLDVPVGITSDGTVLPVAATEALLCDSVVHRVLIADSTVLDYGRGVRSVPAHLFRALALRDGGCRYPDCDRPVAFTEAHHTVHWTADGETDIDELALHCSRHHHHIHAHGIEVKVLPDATVVYTWPDGRTASTRPHPLARPPTLP